tara:strand:+ start:187 stop:420 length:234 start_codon:yes stop_codon:yes gene_type:complete
MDYILHEKENCIGCAACFSLDPENWEMEEDGKSHLKDSNLKDNNEVKETTITNLHKETAECCPVNVIHIYKDNKKII